MKIKKNNFESYKYISKFYQNRSRVWLNLFPKTQHRAGHLVDPKYTVVEWLNN